MIELAPLKELDIYGIFIPPLLLWATISLVLVKISHGILAHRGFYRSDLEQQIFDMALFVIFTCLLSFFIL